MIIRGRRIFTMKDAANKWPLQDKLDANDGAADDYFCFSVRIYGNNTIICAASDNNYKDSAYVGSYE